MRSFRILNNEIGKLEHVKLYFLGNVDVTWLESQGDWLYFNFKFSSVFHVFGTDCINA